jgi:ATP-dependent helicase IRC3
LGIGYDDPRISCVIPAAPTKSFVRYAQQIGRGTRIADGKKECLILDPCDNAAKHNLCSISTLLGLPKDLDMKGETFSKIREKLDRVAKDFPTANLYDIKSLAELDSIAENISLFTVTYPPEIKQLSELAWRQQGEGYFLNVNRERITLSRDLREEWWVKGSINGKPVEIHTQNLAGAFNAADREVLNSGTPKVFLSRNASWRTNPATQGQIEALRRCKIPIPGGITKEQASAALSAHFARSR